MSLTQAEVEHIAALARLRLTEAEKARFGQQLSAILEYMHRLRQVDTSAIEPTASVLPLRSVLRPDVDFVAAFGELEQHSGARKDVSCRR